MSQPSPDARAVVRAIDALTTQVRRAADALQTPVIDAPDAKTTPTDDARVTRLTEMLTAEHYRRAEARIVDTPEGHSAAMAKVAMHALAEHPPPPGELDDEDALRWTRREALGVLLSRAERGVLTTTEAAQLRAHVEAEIRDCNTVRKIARGNRQHVQYLAGEIDRLTAEVNRADKIRAEEQP